MHSIPKELRRLGGKEYIEPIFDTLFWCEPYVIEGVVRMNKLWVIKRVRQIITADIFQLVFNRSYLQRPSSNFDRGSRF